MGEQLAEDLIDSALSDETKRVIADADDPDRRCEFADGTPLHPNAALAVLDLESPAAVDDSLSVRRLSSKSV